MTVQKNTGVVRGMAARDTGKAEEDRRVAARIAFETQLTTEEQLGLLREIIETRNHELCRAYRGVVGLTYGFRRKRNPETGRPEVVRIPCITFIVDKKWEKNFPKRQASVPRYLLAYGTVGGRRVLCAVPTDVDQTASKGEMQLQNRAHPRSINVMPANSGLPSHGTITCALTRSLFGDRAYVLSCRHVFSPKSPPSAVPGQFDLSVRLDSEGSTEFARTLSIGGPDLPAPDISLDAQLAEVSSVENLLSAIGGVRLTGAILTDEKLDTLLHNPQPRTYWILTPDGPVPVEFEKFETEPLGGTRHRKLIRWNFLAEENQTVGGHSGSPVTTEKTGGLLIGMHIGRHRFTENEPWEAIAIPAADLLDPESYGQPRVDSWEVLPLEDMETLVSSSTVATGPTPAESTFLPPLTVAHGFPDHDPMSVRWRLGHDGVRIDGQVPEITVGDPQTVTTVWTRFGDDIRAWATHFRVPVELIIATICTESRGKDGAIRFEPGYISDEDTPHRVSPGLMQTLISTARETLRKQGVQASTVDRNWLLVARNSIQAGTAYIREQFDRRVPATTGYDPPKVACAYNAGRLILNTSDHNRWKMKQYPIGTAEHADRFIKWFNDCFRLFEAEPDLRPSAMSSNLPSMYEMTRQR